MKSALTVRRGFGHQLSNADAPSFDLTCASAGSMQETYLVEEVEVLVTGELLGGCRSAVDVLGRSVRCSSFVR